LGLFVAPAQAQGEAMPLRLEYQVLGDVSVCPDAMMFRAEVQRRAEVDPFADDAKVTARVGITQSEGGFEASIQIVRDGELLGTRTLSSNSCLTVARATALTLVMMRPSSTAQPQPHESTQTPMQAKQLTDKEQPPTLDANAPTLPVEPRSPKPSVEIFAKAGGSLGILPTARESFAIGTRVRQRRWSVETEATVQGSATSSIAGGAIRTSMVSVTAGPCRHFGKFGACAIVSAGLMRSEGLFFTEPMQAETPYAALGARGTWDYGVSERLTIRGSVDLTGTLIRPRLQVAGSPMAEWNAPPASTTLGISISARLW
tara:strand:+ start:27541 stop:28488 length:948 start_codon:yes stop_codon:yes gene_type:complete